MATYVKAIDDGFATLVHYLSDIYKGEKSDMTARAAMVRAAGKNQRAKALLYAVFDLKGA